MSMQLVMTKTQQNPRQGTSGEFPCPRGAWAAPTARVHVALVTAWLHLAVTDCEGSVGDDVGCVGVHP